MNDHVETGQDVSVIGLGAMGGGNQDEHCR